MSVLNHILIAGSPQHLTDAYQVKHIPDNLSSSPDTHIVEGETRLYQVPLTFTAHCNMCACTHHYPTYKQIRYNSNVITESLHRQQWPLITHKTDSPVSCL